MPWCCFVDESGDTGGLPNSLSPVQPVLVIACVAVAADVLPALTQDWIGIKRQFFGASTAPPKFLDGIKIEVKGSELRRSVRSEQSRRRRRAAIGFFDRAVDLLERHDARLGARIWIKGIGAPMDGTAVYTSAIQALSERFQRMLEDADDVGIVIADSRTPALNATVAHSLFTQRFRSSGGGDPYPRILEVPTFGHSQNHAGIQLADLVASGLLFPIAASAHCVGHVLNGTHVSADHVELERRYGRRLAALEMHVKPGTRVAGITVTDGIGARGSGRLFRYRS